MNDVPLDKFIAICRKMNEEKPLDIIESIE